MSSITLNKVEKLELYNQIVEQYGWNSFYWSHWCVELVSLWTKNEFDEVKRESNRIYQRKKRLKARVEEFVKNGKPYFITFTIDPKKDILSVNGYIRVLRDKILKNCSYVFNEDYGGKFGRLHFHCIVKNDIDCMYWFEHYGAFKREPIYYNLSKLSNYMMKLTNHAFKKGCGRIVFSR